MICHAREMAERILNDTLTKQEIIQAEILVRLECPELRACRRALDDLLVKLGQIQRDEASPSVQEQDKRCQIKRACAT